MKISRLLEMILLLMDRKMISAKELAQYFEVSERTIYRDVDTLSMAGIPIYAIKGRNGGISLMEHYVLNKSLISKEEQQQILTSLKSLSVFSEKEATSTLNKLSNFFNLKEEGWLEIDYQSWSNEVSYQKEIALFKKAIIKHKQVNIKYAGKNNRSNRIIDPYKVIYRGSDWYVYAYCNMVKDHRYFKLSRMENIEVLNTTYTLKELPSLTGSYHHNVCEVIIKVNKKMAHRVLDEMKMKIIHEDQNDYLIRITMDEEWLYPYLFSYLDMIEVIEPQEVRRKMKMLADEIRNKY